MSYEKVKNCRIEQREGGWVAIIKSACNNVRPLTYREWAYGKDEGWTKEQLEKALLLDFFHNNLQGGTSKYRTAAKQAYRMGYMNKYMRMDRIIDRLYIHCKNLSAARKEQVQATIDRIYKARDAEAKNALYKCFLEGGAKKTKIRFVVRRLLANGVMEYVTKINRFSYRTSATPKVFTNPDLFFSVSDSSFWAAEGYKVERVGEDFRAA